MCHAVDEEEEKPIMALPERVMAAALSILKQSLKHCIFK